MPNDKNPEYQFWNGKNINGQQIFYDLTSEAPKDGQQELKYDVSSETIAADDL